MEFLAITSSSKCRAVPRAFGVTNRLINRIYRFCHHCSLEPGSNYNCCKSKDSIRGAGHVHTAASWPPSPCKQSCQKPWNHLSLVAFAMDPARVSRFAVGSRRRRAKGISPSHSQRGNQLTQLNRCVRLQCIGQILSGSAECPKIPRQIVDSIQH
jgi:hypothetical protein